MSSEFISAARSALAWFSLGCLVASCARSDGRLSVPSWNAGTARFLHEDIEAHGDIGDKELESGEENELFVSVSAVACTILFLIAVTIAFEKTKEHIEETADRAMKPIIQSLFGEMTVLGFLSAVTFCITKMGFFAALSVRIFGEHEKEGLLEIFEAVHFCLFFIMIFFLVQVIRVLKQASHTEHEWLKMDAECQDTEYISKIRTEASSKQDNYTKDLLLFESLRDEFIKDRSLEPPFLPADGPDLIPDDFNFGRYLSICLGTTLGHCVEVDVLTWAFYALLTVVFYVVWLLLDYNLMVLSWIWVALAYLVVAFNLIFQRYLVSIRNAFARDSPPDSDRHVTKPEENSLLAEEGQESLPRWCRIDINEHMSKRLWLANALSRKVPNRQDALFWLEKSGPRAHLLIFQAVLIFVSIYFALLLLLFIPAMFKERVGLAIAYIILSVVPIVFKEIRAPKRVAVMTQVSCMGVLRKPQAISTVIREDKTENIVRAFIVICRLNRAAENGFPKKSSEGGASRVMPFSRAIAKDIEQTFEIFDHSGDGYVETEELGAILAKIGTPLTDEKLQGMVTLLDENKDGKVSKDEFIQWYSDQTDDADLTLEEQVHFIFNMFDKDGSGDVSIAEFKATLDGFNVQFTVDEIGELVRELDENGNGTIGIKEFEELVEKHYPRELGASHGH